MNSELETLVSMETSEQIVLDEASHEINSLLRSGIDAAKNGSRDEAKALLFRVTDIEPENEMAWLWLASVSEYPEELLTFLQKVLHINPANEQALEWEQSTKALLARNLVQYGITAVQENKKESAKRCFNRALETDENNEMAWLWLASIAEDADEKVSNLEKVLSINPENEVANTLLKLMRKDEAAELLQKSKASAARGNHEQAMELLEQVRELDTNLDEVWVLKGHLSQSFEEKAFCFNQALSFNPDNEAARAGLVSIDSILQALNADGSTRPLSPQMKKELEAAGRENAVEEVLNDEILVEDSEEEMASSFAEETEMAMSPVGENNGFVAENPAFSDLFAEEQVDETIDTGELYFEAPAVSEVEEAEQKMAHEPTEEIVAETENEVAEIKEEVVEESVEENEASMHAEQESGLAETEEAPEMQDEMISEMGTESMESADDNVEDDNDDSTEMASDNGHYSSNGFASLFQSETESFSEQANFEDEMRPETFNPESLLDDEAEDEAAPAFQFSGTEEISHSDNGFHHDSFVQHEEQHEEVTESHKEETEEPSYFSNEETAPETHIEEAKFEPEQADEEPTNEGIYTFSESSDEEVEDEEAPVAEVAHQENEIKAQTFYFGQSEREDVAEMTLSEETVAAEEKPSEMAEEMISESNDADTMVNVSNAEAAEMQHEEAHEDVMDESAEDMATEMHEESISAEAEPQAEDHAQVEMAYEEDVVSQGEPCPFCDTKNNINDEVCGGCNAVLGLHNMDMLMSRENTDEKKLSESVAQMEAELESKDSVSAEEYFNLGLACLNMKDFDKGLKYLQKSYILNPTNSFLKTQIDELTKRMGKMNNLEVNTVETAVAGKTIMVVDDSATIRKLVSAKLEKHGHNVVMAVDGMDALAKLEEFVPDLILLDITMPRLDGYQVCKLIRANDNTRFVPVVLISGKDGFFDKVRGKMCGSTSYITKPFGPEMLLRTVEGYFN